MGRLDDIVARNRGERTDEQLPPPTVVPAGSKLPTTTRPFSLPSQRKGDWKWWQVVGVAVLLFLLAQAKFGWLF